MPRTIQGALDAPAASGGPPPEAVPEALPGGVAPLWTVRDLARFLGRSPRWVFAALRRGSEERGSIPFLRLPGRGAPRFVPEAIREWVSLGCPPAAALRGPRGRKFPP